MDMISTLIRRDNGTADAPPPACPEANTYNGKFGIRVASIFVIAFAATLGGSLSKSKQSSIH